MHNIYAYQCNSIIVIQLYCGLYIVYSLYTTSLFISNSIVQIRVCLNCWRQAASFIMPAHPPTIILVFAACPFYPVAKIHRGGGKKQKTPTPPFLLGGGGRGCLVWRAVSNPARRLSCRSAVLVFAVLRLWRNLSCPPPHPNLICWRR